jgi:xylan 1,4-beta-xylosidase
MTRRRLPLVLLLLVVSGILAAAYSVRDQAPPEPAVAVTVDLAHVVGAYRPIYAWFGYDEANYTTMRDGRKLLRTLRDLSPVPVQIRVHHLFSSGDGVAALKWSSTNVYSEDAAGRPVYDFTILDKIFDEFKAAGVVPMVELGFTPKALTSGTQPYEDRYPDFSTGGSVHNPPKDFGKWQELNRVVTAHLVERYGRKTVAGWYFEVWNEPDISYWKGTPQQYWELYDRAIAGVRAALPEARVGGPATTGPRGQNAYRWLDDFLKHVEDANVPLDFISFHAKGQPRFQDGGVVMGLAQELADVDRGFEIVARHPRFKSLPIILSEADPEGCAACSMKVNPANAYRNGTLYPAYTAAAYKRLFELADAHGVNLISMLSWSFEFENHEYFEGFRSLSTNGIDKPILNFFRMAALMRGNRVATTSTGGLTAKAIVSSGVRGQADVDALATTDGRGASVMLWNYHDDERNAPGAPATVTVRGFPASAARVRLTHYRIDETHSNAYTAWKAMGSPQHPTRAQLERLTAVAGLQPLEPPRSLRVSNGAIEIAVEMPRHAVSLLQMTW